MTEEEIEKQAEEYAIQNYGTEDVVQSNLLQSIAKDSFQDGAKWGIANAIQWHNLRENPSDLPKDINTFVLNQDGEKCRKYPDLWIDIYGNGVTVIAWCELPQFKE